MSKIAVVVEADADKTSTVAALRAATGRSVLELSRALQSTQSAAEFTLFGNNHDEVAARLRRLVRDLSDAGAAIHVYELDESESFDMLADASMVEISPTTLARLLESYERERERQERLSERGL